jgi:hypothetical protein
MAIDPKQIDTQLTLEMDEDEISISEFGKAYDNFTKLVREVSKHVNPRKDSGAWNVRVYEGSAGIGVRGRPGVFTAAEVNIIRSQVITGLEEMERGIRPVQFTDAAIEASRQLATLFKSKTVPAKVRLWSDGTQAYRVTKTIATSAATMLDAEYEDHGTVDGTLETLTSHKGLEFVVYSLINNRSVKCEVNEALAEVAHKNWRKRVEVVGTVRYRKDGVPVSVKATDIIAYPDPQSLPSLADLRRALAGA